MPKTHHDQTLPNTMVKGKESKCNVQGMSKQPRQKPPWSGCAGSQSLPVAAALPHSCSFSFATARFLRNSAVWCFEYINTLCLAAKRGYIPLLSSLQHSKNSTKDHHLGDWKKEKEDQVQLRRFGDGSKDHLSALGLNFNCPSLFF